MRPGSAARGPSGRGLSVGITTAGRIAGYTTASCLASMSIAYMAGSWDELTCRPHTCAHEAAKAGLVWFAASFLITLAAAIAWTIHRTPADPGGGSGWTWGLVALFIAGTWVMVTQIPSFTCPAGYHLDVGFRMCIGRLRFGATNWTWLKALLSAISAVVALILIRPPRAIPWSAGAAALAWFVGMGWYLHDTLLKAVG